MVYNLYMVYTSNGSLRAVKSFVSLYDFWIEKQKRNNYIESCKIIDKFNPSTFSSFIAEPNINIVLDWFLAQILHWLTGIKDIHFLLQQLIIFSTRLQMYHKIDGVYDTTNINFWLCWQVGLSQFFQPNCLDFIILTLLDFLFDIQWAIHSVCYIDVVIRRWTTAATAETSVHRLYSTYYLNWWYTSRIDFHHFQIY